MDPCFDGILDIYTQVNVHYCQPLAEDALNATNMQYIIYPHQLVHAEGRTVT